MKKIVLIVVLMAFSSCTKLFSSRLQTTLKSNPISDGITYHDYNMIMSSSSATFTHIASVNAHILNGKLLQATGFEVQNSYAFIVYNTAGDTIRGGLDIISLSTLNAPVLVSSVVSENTEYAEVKASGNYLYMVGQKKNINKNDAMLTIVDMSNKSAPFVVSELVFPNGYYATSIDIQGQNAYISVPNEGVKVVNISNPLSPLLVSTEVSSFGNSLYVRRLDSKSIVLGGSSSHNVSSISNGVSIGLKQISTKVQEAPSRFILNNNSLYTNGGNTGLTILDSMSSSAPIQKSQNPLPGTGNGLAIDSCNQLYLAQGEVGLMVIDVSDRSNPLQKGIFDFVGSKDAFGSANNVALINAEHNLYVLVANGLGGVEIVKVSQEICPEDD